MDKLEIKIFYDNRSLKGFKHAWGFSALIRVNDKNILFDTGANPEILFYNMKKLDFSPENIDIIVISHSHLDHTGGLPYILGLKEDVDIYLPKYMKSNKKFEFKMYGSDATNFKETDGIRVIIEDMLTVACTQKIYEQILLIHLKEGLLIMTGCAHPGLDNIINFSQEIDKIYGVMGGFHGFSKLKKLENIEFIAPCHCTQFMDEIKIKFKENFVNCAAGSVFEFDLE
ncbi:MAG: MBL fold metallo-hydrolase [Promethearchaeota archaeon]|nr:MAG: MBL fold metallo-hydrolase [Candidatus Lokiarchaeota archaeon]